MEEHLKTLCALMFDLRTGTHFQPGERRHLELTNEKAMELGEVASSGLATRSLTWAVAGAAGTLSSPHRHSTNTEKTSRP